jgi:hypothetical protein
MKRLSAARPGIPCCYILQCADGSFYTAPHRKRRALHALALPGYVGLFRTPGGCERRAKTRGGDQAAAAGEEGGIDSGEENSEASAFEKKITTDFSE